MRDNQLEIMRSITRANSMKLSISYLISLIETKIVNIDKKFEDYMKKAEQDYEYFFRWYARELYTAELNRRYLRSIKKDFFQCDGTKERLLSILDWHLRDLQRNLEVYGTNILSSTCPVTNITQVDKIQFNIRFQSYIKELMDLINSSEME